MFRRFIQISLLLLLFAAPAAAQSYKIKGTVYDSSRLYTIELVSVMSTSGRGTTTDADGHYEIEVTDRDSIWFSFLNKPTIKFPVARIEHPLAFDISIQINIPVLKEVKVRQRNYKLDSIQNREDYAKVFNFRKPTISPSVNGMGVGFDLDEMINMLRFKRTRSMLAFQKRLEMQEQDKFVDHRFSKALVRRLTQLQDTELDSFMRIYRPSYEFTLLTSDYDFQEYILENYRRYLNGLPPLPMIKQEETDSGRVRRR